MDKSHLIGLMGNIQANEIHDRLKQAASLADQLSTTPSSGRIEILKRIVSRITVYRDRVDIAVCLGTVCSLPDASATESMTMIVVPVELKRCGLGVRLIVRNSGEVINRGPDPTLVALMTKAHDWFERLSSGRSESVQAIAQEEKVDRSYARRVIYLAFLDPEIVKRILCGDHPLELNATRLIRMTPLPMAWAEQRVVLGITI